MVDLHACSWSDGIVFDPTAPTQGQVCAFTATGWQCGNPQSSTPVYLRHQTYHHYNSKNTIARFSWHGFKDEESGILSFEWAIGSTPSGTDLISWTYTRAKWETSFTLDPLVREELRMVDREIYITVRCTNHAGLSSQASQMVRFDETPPVVQVRSRAHARALHQHAHPFAEADD